MTIATENKVLVCIDAHPNSNALFRLADKKVKELKCGWIVLYVENISHHLNDKDSRRRILHFLTLAKEIGAEIHHIESHDIAQAVVNFIGELSKQNTIIKHLIIGQSVEDSFFARFKPSLGEKIARKLRNSPIEINIIPLADNSGTSLAEKFQPKEIKIKGVLFAFLIVILCSLISEIVQRMLPISWQIKSSIAIALFISSSIVASLLHGLIAGLIVSVLGFLIVDYLYIFPVYSFAVSHESDVINLAIFFISSIILSFMGAFNRGYSSALLRKKRRSQALYEIHGLATGAKNKEEAIKILHSELTKLLEAELAFFLPDPKNSKDIKLTYPSGINLSRVDERNLLKCWDKSNPTGLGTNISLNSPWRFEPLTTMRGDIGVVGIKFPKNLKIDSAFVLLLKALAEQSASVLERLDLATKMNESRFREEREKLRSMLLSSVSHDLKTPLSCIIGSLSVYKKMKKSNKLDEETANELIDTALEEGQRLNNFISNILDMTRIESGDIEFNKEWVESNLPIEQIKSESALIIKGRELIIDNSYCNYEVEMDLNLTKQVIKNIIDNAVKYSPDKSKITISCEKRKDGFLYKIKDEGKGIKEEKLEAIFDKYERLNYADSQIAGTGLGLSICKAIMEEQGGTIEATNHPDGGAEFIILFPNYR